MASPAPSASASGYPISEYVLPLPASRGTASLCVRIHNARAAAGDVDGAVPVPDPRDTHLLLVHGWLDNSSSWDPTLPRIIARYAAASIGSGDSDQSRLVCYAVEMSGHGKSAHRSPSVGGYTPQEHALDIAEAVTALRLPSGFLLCGHSMGGAVAYMLASALGTRVGGLVLVDSVGPWIPAAEISFAASAARSARPDPAAAPVRTARVYSSKEQIVDKYVAANPFMDDSSARLLAERAVVEAADGGGWTFRHDARLRTSTRQRPPEENTLAAFRQITCPVLIFLATNVKRKKIYSTVGRNPRSATHWSLPEHNPAYAGIMAKRIEALGVNKECTVKMVEGDHHIHMDAASVDGMAEDMSRWIQRARELQQQKRTAVGDNREVAPKDAGAALRDFLIRSDAAAAAVPAPRAKL